MASGLSQCRLTLGAEARIPPAEGLFPLAVEHTGANLQKQMGAALAPFHLLFLDHPFAHHVVHRRFHKARADTFAVAVALAIVGDEGTVILNVGGKFASAIPGSHISY